MASKITSNKTSNITSKPRWTAWLPLVLLGAAVFAAYVPSLSGLFLVDDLNDIVHNPRLSTPGFWYRAFWDPFTLTPNQALINYRPLTAISLALSALAGSRNPFWFHLTAVILHVANVCLVYLLCLRVIGREKRIAAAAAALFFALHPAQVETVSCITTSHGTLLSFFFCTASLLVYARENAESRWRRFASVGLFACGLLSKESSAATIFLLPIADWLLSADRDGRGRWWRRWAPYAVVILLYIVLRQAVLGRWAMRDLWGGDWFANAQFMGWGLFQDIRIALWPTRLRACYSFNVGSGFVIGAIWRWEVLLVIIAGAAYALRRRSRSAFALTWFLTALLPVSNIFPIEALSADRFLYAPLAGLALLCAEGVSFFGEKEALLLGPLLILPWLSCVEHQLAWQDGFNLDLAAYAAAPQDACTSLDLATHYFNWRMFGKAQTLAGLAAREEAQPNIRRAARKVVALSRMQQGACRDAMNLLELISAEEPSQGEPHYLLGLCALKLGDRRRAAAEFGLSKEWAARNLRRD